MLIEPYLFCDMVDEYLYFIYAFHEDTPLVYNAAHWLFQNAFSIWKWLWCKNFFLILIFIIPVGVISFYMLMLSGLFYMLSFMTILENMALGLFRYFKNKMKVSGFFGKVLYLPFFLCSAIFCGLIFVMSLGTAMGESNNS